MLDFLTLSSESFGLDMSDLSFKIVQLKKRRGGFDLACWGEHSLSPGIIEKGEIKNEREATRAIKKTLANIKGRKTKTQHVSVSLPEEKAFLQVVQMPKMPEGDLKRAIRFEAENYIPLSIDEVYLDFEVVKPYKNHLDHIDVLINALPKKIVDPYLSIVKKAGLRPQAFEIESQSVIRSLIKKGKPTLPIAIIDIGRSRISFIIFAGNSLRFTSTIPLSSQGFDEAISEKMKIGQGEAEKIKTKYDLTKRKKNKKQKEVFKAMEPVLEELIRQIRKYVNFYRTHDFHSHLPKKKRGEITKLVLCGGGANLTGLDKYVSQEIGIPVEVGNPWVNVFSESPKEILGMGKEKALCFTSAIGLALRKID